MTVCPFQRFRRRNVLMLFFIIIILILFSLPPNPQHFPTTSPYHILSELSLGGNRSRISTHPHLTITLSSLWAHSFILKTWLKTGPDYAPEMNLPSGRERTISCWARARFDGKQRAICRRVSFFFFIPFLLLYSLGMQLYNLMFL